MNEKFITSAARAYFDTNSIIYFVETNAELQAKVAELWYALIMRNANLVTSEISIAECLYGAFKRQSQALERSYNRLFFQENTFDIHPLDLESLIEAARLGASLGLRLIDAVHFHTAMATKCDIFVTNDRRCRSSHGVRIVQIGEL